MSQFSNKHAIVIKNKHKTLEVFNNLKLLTSAGDNSKKGHLTGRKEKKSSGWYEILGLIKNTAIQLMNIGW